MQLKVKIYLVLILIIACYTSAPTFAQQGLSNSIAVDSIDTSAFPNVRMNLRVVGTDGRVIPNIDNFVIDENGVAAQNLNVTSADSGPVYIVFVVDFGFADTAMDASVKQFMSLLAGNNFLREGQDTVAIIVNSDTSGAQLLLQPTKSVSQFSSVVNSLTRPPSNSSRRSLDAITSALSLIDASGNAHKIPTFVIYIGQMFERPLNGSFEDVAAKVQQQSAKLGTPIFSVDAELDKLNGAVQRQRVQQLAVQTGGQFLRLENNQNNTPQSVELYNSIFSQRLEYLISYRSALGLSGDRTISISGAGANTRANYNISLQPPNVEIIAPIDNIDRQAIRNSDGDSDPKNDTWSFNVSSAPVEGQISWPDGIQRVIRSASLLVDGQTVGTLSNQTANQISFTWDLAGIKDKGTNQRQLEIQVTDELGLSHSSPSKQIGVLVNIPEDVIAPTIVETTVVRSNCEANPTGRECIQDRVTMYGPYIALVICGVIILRYRRQLSHQVGQVATNLATNVGHTFIKVRNTVIGNTSRSQLASLQILDGPPDRRGQQINIYDRLTIFGRDPEHTDIQLYRFEDRSSISRKHCSLKYDEKVQRFYLIDHNSSAGTRVNGRPVTGDGIELSDGDTIELGQVQDNGARLRFQMAGTPKTANSSGVTNIQEPLASPAIAISDRRVSSPHATQLESISIPDPQSMSFEPNGNPKNENLAANMRNARRPKRNNDADWLKKL